MPHLVVFRDGRLVQVLALPSGPVELAVRGEALVPAKDAEGDRLIASAFGSSCELRALGALKISAAGKETARQLVRDGDGVKVGALALHFSAAGEPKPVAPPQPTGRWLDALHVLARKCHTDQEPAQLLESVMDALMGICNAQRGFLVLGDGRGELDIAVARKLKRSDTDHFSATVVRQALASRQPVLVDDAARDPSLKEQKSVIAAKLRSIVAVPLLEGDLVRGAVYLDRSMAESIFSPEDVALLQAAAAHVVAALENAEARARLREDGTRLRAVVETEVKREHDTGHIVGSGPAMRSLMETVRKVAAQDTSTLILGESGTGKELLARAIHDASGRRRGPFVAVNCMALAADLMETELFGHEKGAFTGAAERRAGRFELAEGGTIFLDEIGELDMRTQVRLLRVLQERVIERVGGSKPIPIDIRLVCATHVDMEKAVAEGRFREDLYYRIAVFPLAVPPLRDRAEDVPALAEHFVKHFRERSGRAIRGLTPAARELLARYRWPGNVRELKNVIERAFVLEGSDEITPASLPLSPKAMGAAPAAAAPAAPSAGKPQRFPVPDRGHLIPAREAFERNFILDCLDRNGQNVSKAARELGVPRSSIYRRLDRPGGDADE